ncbi:MAG: helix-turn-helix transcriptional regulator [Oscillospiraceae bacterium]|nr:helix-turn-helix transcriptional regulator [Oscillospiraceae bacterium]
MFNIRKFGAYISKLRKHADMTQSVLGEKLNVTRQAVSRYENGDSFPDISILVLLSEIFNVSVDDLIKAGEPTKAEAILLQSDIKQSEIPQEIFKEKTITDDILNIASLLKPSLLDKIAKGFEKHDIDISKLTNLAEYLSDETFVSMLENSSFETLDKNILEKFVPFLDDNSRGNIFKQVIDGELDYNFLELLAPYVDPYYFSTQVEAAVVYGVLPAEALKTLEKLHWPA